MPGDTVEKNLMAMAAKRIKLGMAFSTESQAEIRRIIERLIGKARSAAAVFITPGRSDRPSGTTSADEQLI